MVGTTEAISTLSEAFKKKTTAFLTLGILLMIASMYINVLKTGAGDIGVSHSIVIIWFAILFQVISWIKFFKLFPAQPGSEYVVTDNESPRSKVAGASHEFIGAEDKWEKLLTVIFLYLTTYTIIKDGYINKLSPFESWLIPIGAAFFTGGILFIVYYFYIKKLK